MSSPYTGFATYTPYDFPFKELMAAGQISEAREDKSYDALGKMTGLMALDAAPVHEDLKLNAIDPYQKRIKEIVNKGDFKNPQTYRDITLLQNQFLNDPKIQRVKQGKEAWDKIILPYKNDKNNRFNIDHDGYFNPDGTVNQTDQPINTRLNYTSFVDVNKRYNDAFEKMKASMLDKPGFYGVDVKTTPDGVKYINFEDKKTKEISIAHMRNIARRESTAISKEQPYKEYWIDKRQTIDGVNLPNDKALQDDLYGYGEDLGYKYLYNETEYNQKPDVLYNPYAKEKEEEGKGLLFSSRLSNVVQSGANPAYMKNINNILDKGIDATTGKFKNDNNAVTAGKYMLSSIWKNAGGSLTRVLGELIHSPELIKKGIINMEEGKVDVEKINTGDDYKKLGEETAKMLRIKYPDLAKTYPYDQNSYADDENAPKLLKAVATANNKLMSNGNVIFEPNNKEFTENINQTLIKTGNFNLNEITDNTGLLNDEQTKEQLGYKNGIDDEAIKKAEFNGYGGFLQPGHMYITLPNSENKSAQIIAQPNENDRTIFYTSNKAKEAINTGEKVTYQNPNDPSVIVEISPEFTYQDGRLEYHAMIRHFRMNPQTRQPDPIPIGGFENKNIGGQMFGKMETTAEDYYEQVEMPAFTGLKEFQFKKINK